MSVPVTSLYVCLSAAWVLYLAVRVVGLRRHHQTGLGDREHRDLAVAVRVHANALENMLVTLLLMLVFELNGGRTVLLHAAGVTLLLTRFAHAYGMTVSGGRYSPFRFYGILFNWVLLLVLILANLWLLASR